MITTLYTFEDLDVNTKAMENPFALFSLKGLSKKSLCKHFAEEFQKLKSIYGEE